MHLVYFHISQKTQLAFQIRALTFSRRQADCYLHNLDGLSLLSRLWPFVSNVHTQKTAHFGVSMQSVAAVTLTHAGNRSGIWMCTVKQASKFRKLQYFLIISVNMSIDHWQRIVPVNKYRKPVGKYPLAKSLASGLRSFCSISQVWSSFCFVFYKQVYRLQCYNGNSSSQCDQTCVAAGCWLQ